MNLSDICYKDIELSRKQKKLLKQAKKKTVIANTPRIEENMRVLEEFSLVDQTNHSDYHFGHDEHPAFQATTLGHMLLRYLIRNSWKYWYPHIISTIALIVAIMSYLKP